MTQAVNQNFSFNITREFCSQVFSSECTFKSIAAKVTCFVLPLFAFLELLYETIRWGFSCCAIQAQVHPAPISLQTVEKLRELADGLMNEGQVVMTRGDKWLLGKDRTEKAEEACERFKNYYQSLSAAEKRVLNAFEMKSWPKLCFHAGMAYTNIKGMDAANFETIYQRLEAREVEIPHCGLAIARILLQLDPDIRFEASHHYLMNEFIAELRLQENHPELVRGESEQYGQKPYNAADDVEIHPVQYG